LGTVEGPSRTVRSLGEEIDGLFDSKRAVRREAYDRRLLDDPAGAYRGRGVPGFYQGRK
jgi:hypothetical protein